MKKTIALLGSVRLTLHAAVAQTALSPHVRTPAASGPETAVTASQDDSWMGGKYGLGTMSGMRNDMFDAGIEPFLYYTSIVSGNPVGGKQHGTTYVDDFYFGANLYLDKLMGWSGAKLTVSSVNRDGTGLTENYVGSRYDVQQAVGGQNVFLYQVFLDHVSGITKSRSSSAGSAPRTISTARKSMAFTSTTASTVTSATSSSTPNSRPTRSPPGRRGCGSIRPRNGTPSLAFSRLGTTSSIAPTTA